MLEPCKNESAEDNDKDKMPKTTMYFVVSLNKLLGVNPTSSLTCALNSSPALNIE